MAEWTVKFTVLYIQSKEERTEFWFQNGDCEQYAWHFLQSKRRSVWVLVDQLITCMCDVDVRLWRELLEWSAIEIEVPVRHFVEIACGHCSQWRTVDFLCVQSASHCLIVRAALATRSRVRENRRSSQTGAFSLFALCLRLRSPASLVFLSASAATRTRRRLYTFFAALRHRRSMTQNFGGLQP